MPAGGCKSGEKEPGRGAGHHRAEKRLKKQVGNDPTTAAELMPTRFGFIPRHLLLDRPDQGPLIGPTWDGQGPATGIWHTSRLNFSPASQPWGAAVARALIELPLRSLHDGDTGSAFSMAVPHRLDMRSCLEARVTISGVAGC